MRARETFSVLGTTSVPVQMERCVAKYTLHISVADAFSSFTLRSFQVVNVPRTYNRSPPYRLNRQPELLLTLRQTFRDKAMQLNFTCPKTNRE